MEKLPYRILLVDDDPIVLMGIGRELEAQGYVVSTAKSGEAALAILDGPSADFDLVITDLIMGNVSGIEVLKRSKQVNPDGMAMIMTGYGDLNSAIQAIRLGADEYMLKPGSPEERTFRIHEVLEKYELKQKLKLYEKILPVCCVCKKIRNDAGKNPGEGCWMSVEEYLNVKGKIQVTSTYCPVCYQGAIAKIRQK